MAGRGYATAEDLKPIPGVLHFARDLTWREAIEPIHKDRSFVGTFAPDGTKRVSPDPWDAVPPADGDRVVGVGCGRTFGRLLRAFAPDVDVGLVPTAVGGTPISAWLPGGIDPYDKANHPYDDAIKRARVAQQDGKFVAILWHQGEADASLGTPDYEAKLQRVVENFRRDLGLGVDVPFIAGTLASFHGDLYPKIEAGVPAIDAALEHLAETMPGFGLISTKGLPDRGDGLHFSAEAQHTLGERYFEKWKAMTTTP